MYIQYTVVVGQWALHKIVIGFLCNLPFCPVNERLCCTRMSRYLYSHLSKTGTVNITYYPQYLETNVTEYWSTDLKGQCRGIFDFWFFLHESVSPKHLSITVRPFQIFSKIHGDISGSRCTTGVVNTGGNWKKFCLQVHFKVSAAWYCSHYLPPVSLTPVVHLELRISPWIVEKNWNDPPVIFRGLGEGDSWKKPEEKNLVTLSL